MHAADLLTAKMDFYYKKKETSVAGSFIHSIECILTHSQNIQHKICIRPIPLFTECVKFWRTHRSVCTSVSRRLQWGWNGVAVTVIFWIKLKTECILQQLSWKYFKKLFLMNLKAFGESIWPGSNFPKIWQYGNNAVRDSTTFGLLWATYAFMLWMLLRLTNFEKFLKNYK